MRCEVYIYGDNRIAHIIDEAFIVTPDPDTTRVIVFDTDEYPDEFEYIRNHDMAWDGTNLLHDGAIYLDSAWIQARQEKLLQAGNDATEDSNARATLLSLAASALTQIASDRTAIANGKTAAQAATTLAQMRTIILGMLDVMDNTCNRQDREIRALRAIIRNGLGSG